MNPTQVPIRTAEEADRDWLAAYHRLLWRMEQEGAWPGAVVALPQDIERHATDDGRPFFTVKLAARGLMAHGCVNGQIALHDGDEETVRQMARAFTAAMNGRN